MFFRTVTAEAVIGQDGAHLTLEELSLCGRALLGSGIVYRENKAKDGQRQEQSRSLPVHFRPFCSGQDGRQERAVAALTIAGRVLPAVGQALW
jgi:hypothetical protein